MKILVTGGTGLLGGRLIPKLIEDGHQIVALTRSASSHGKLKAMGATPVAGDLERPRHSDRRQQHDRQQHGARGRRHAGLHPRLRRLQPRRDGDHYRQHHHRE